MNYRNDLDACLIILILILNIPNYGMLFLGCLTYFRTLID
jgi:hypothetical protein